MAFLLLAPLGLFRRRLWKKYRGLTILILLLCGSLGAMTMTGCSNKLQGVTPAGTSTVTFTVSGTDGSTTVSQSAQIALTVQK
jgi:drug/metabolite transporter (DMT)-like permease